MLGCGSATTATSNRLIDCGGACDEPPINYSLHIMVIYSVDDEDRLSEQLRCCMSDGRCLRRKDFDHFELPFPIVAKLV